jgi:hypothetical protein
VAIPKFAHVNDRRRANSGISNHTTNAFAQVRFLDLKFAPCLVRDDGELQLQHTCGALIASGGPPGVLV